MVTCDLNLKHLDQIIAKRLTILAKKSLKMEISHLYVKVMLFFFIFFLYIYYKDTKSKLLHC